MAGSRGNIFCIYKLFDLIGVLLSSGGYIELSARTGLNATFAHIYMLFGQL